MQMVLTTTDHLTIPLSLSLSHVLGGQQKQDMRLTGVGQIGYSPGVMYSKENHQNITSSWSSHLLQLWRKIFLLLYCSQYAVYLLIWLGSCIFFNSTTTGSMSYICYLRCFLCISGVLGTTFRHQDHCSQGFKFQSSSCFQFLTDALFQLLLSMAGS